MKYSDKLEQWFQQEKAEGRLVDLKLTLPTYEEKELQLGRKLSSVEKEEMLESSAKAIYETLTGQRKTVDITHKKL